MRRPRRIPKEDILLGFHQNQIEKVRAGEDEAATETRSRTFGVSEISNTVACGLAAALERRLNRRLGLELGALFADPDVNFDASRGGGFQVGANEGVALRAITLGLNVHLTPDKAVDLYAGPLLAHTSYGDLRFLVGAAGDPVDIAVSSSDNFTVGAQIGADIPLGNNRWSLNLLARYLDSSLDVAAGEQRTVRQLDYDPLIFGVGIGFRF